MYRENLVKPGSTSPLPEEHRISPSLLKSREEIRVQTGPVLSAPPGPTPTVRIESLPARSGPQLQPPPAGRMANQNPTAASSAAASQRPVSPLARTSPLLTQGQGTSVVEQFNLLAKKAKDFQDIGSQQPSTATHNSTTTTTIVTTSNSTPNHQAVDNDESLEAQYPAEVMSQYLYTL